ncbi:MAG TPA: hypothetical protein H9716_10120 [Candidatus Enterocloster faecavium]|uniref:Ig-like domain-containing protein n=1 Tax=Candidatus Enterocloster faecavium TaxID=2838560 RepID=A0A9D2RM81_9FIRM|nr:hypothetical protein [Candidatus Enterocloster faecavium]
MNQTTVCWNGEDGLKWKAELGILEKKPCIFTLAYEKNHQWVVLAEKLIPQFKVVTGKRTVHNPQREKPMDSHEKPDYQWDTYSDDPFGKKDVNEAIQEWNTEHFEVKSSEKHTTVSFDGLTLGPFTGGCDFNFFDGTNLIRMEAVAFTEEDGVAYLYHAGMDGFEIGKLYYVSPKRREVYENPGFHTNSGPDQDRERVYTRGRVLTLGLKNGAAAVFPSPHRFFWGGQTENIVGNNYYIRKAGKDTMEIGIRHNKSPEHFNVRWPGYNAKPGTIQRMSVFFMPSADSVYVTMARVMRYTNFDHLRDLLGYKRLGAHMHVAAQAAWIRDPRKQRPWEMLIRELGMDIFAPCDFWAEGRCEDNREGRKADLERYQAMAKCCSTPDFLVVPAEELADRTGKKVLIRFHCMLFPSKPLLYSRWRDEDQEFAEKLPDGRIYYHLKSSEDFVEMCRRENCFILMPHPDTKANDGLPYDCRDESWFKDERWFGIGCRMLPADNSVPTMISGRIERVWNDINNWSSRPRYIISELDTYTKVDESEEDWEMYPMTNCTYVQLEKLPGPDNWEELTDALREGRHFYSTGEILLESCQMEDGSCNATFSWTYPLAFVQLVYSDGVNVRTVDILREDTLPYGKETIYIEFPSKMKWARVLATDIAGNSVFGMPVFI